MFFIVMRGEKNFPLIVAALGSGRGHEVEPRVFIKQRLVLEEGESSEVARVHRTFLLTCREHVRGISMVLYPLSYNLDGV